MSKYKGKKTDVGFIPNFRRLNRLLDAWLKGQTKKESDLDYTGTKLDDDDVL